MRDGLFNIVITEKLGVATKIACALCPNAPCNTQGCPYYYVDIFVHHLGRVDKYKHAYSLLRCRSKQLHIDEEFRYYWGRNEDYPLASLIFSSRVDGARHNNIMRSIRELLSNWNVAKVPRPIMEHVDWYDIGNGYDNSRWLIIHTSGNPLRLDIRNDVYKHSKSEKHSLTFASNDPQDVKKKMEHVPNHSSEGSSRMRLRHISKMLNLPYITGSVYVATDMDVAGTYIASTLPGFDSIARRKDILRLSLCDTTREGVRNAIAKSVAFDWHNAEAGRFRDTIDYVIGRSFYDITKDISHIDRVSAPLSFGRTQLLALDCLYRRWVLAQTWKQKGDIYLVFIGLGDKQGIADQLSQKAYLGIALNTLRGPFSQAGLLRELMYREIATVSTRHRIIDTLIRQGLARQEGMWLLPTEAGIMVHQVLLQRKQLGQLLWEWNHRINRYMHVATEFANKPLDELQDNTDREIKEFLSQFLPALIGSVSSLSLLYKLLERNNHKGERHKDKKEEYVANSISEDYDLHELHGALGINSLNKIVDSKNNRMVVDQNIVLKRRIPAPEIDSEGTLRRLLKLEREVGFQVVDSWALNSLPHLPEGMCTTFRARCAPDETLRIFQNAINSGDNIEDIELTVVEKPEEDKDHKDSHEPLGIFDVTPGDINGPKGFLVASEYMRPYRYTLDLHKASLAKYELLEKFSLGGLLFQRIHPFRFGTVHTFDTLLIDMYDRHLMSFHDTSENAESLYIGSRL